MPRSKTPTLGRVEQKIYDRMVAKAVAILSSFGYKVDAQTVFTKGETIGYFRALIQYKMPNKSATHKKIKKIILEKTDICYEKTYLW